MVPKLCITYGRQYVVLYIENIQIGTVVSLKDR